MPSLIITPSNIHGMGLFTRYVIESGQLFIYVFNKVAEMGDFAQDYKENMYGRYINHANTPNTRTVMLKEGIALCIAPLINRTGLTLNLTNHFREHTKKNDRRKACDPQGGAGKWNYSYL